jgi:hypothetical protein
MSIKTFSYNETTIDLFTDYSNIFQDYAITIFNPKYGTLYVNRGIKDIYEASKIFDNYKMDLLKEA